MVKYPIKNVASKSKFLHSFTPLTVKKTSSGIMKRLMKGSFFILLMWSGLFLCCSKSSSPGGSPPPQQTTDTLSGREFEFTDLTWKRIPSWAANVMVEIDRPDLFFNFSRALKVTIRLDTSSVWLNVFHDNGAYFGGSNFYYATGGSDFFNAVSGSLYIFPVPPDFSLNGRKVSVKVKFT
jgi:hypothetical protein